MNTVLSLDNAPTNCSETPINFLKNQGFNTIFLQAYSPQLAPVEVLFSILKTKIRSWEEYSKIDFNKMSGMNWIFSCMSTIDISKSARLWNKLIIACFEILAQSTK